MPIEREPQSVSCSLSSLVGGMNASVPDNMIGENEAYPYNAGTLTSADVTAVQVGDNVIQLPNSMDMLATWAGALIGTCLCMIAQI